MTDFNKKAQAVAKKFEKDGEASVLRRIVYGDYDPDIGGKPVLRDDAYPCFVMCFDYDLQGSGQSNLPGSLIQAGDKQILLPAYGVPVAPEQEDLIIVGGRIIADAVVGGVTWVVKNVKTVAPTSIAVLHELNGRK